MRSLCASIVLAAWAAALAGPAAAADITTVKGEVIDLACSISRGEAGKGEAHAACAMTCAKRGNQMALLTADDVYVIEGDYAANGNAKLLDFVARLVEAKGTVIERDGRKAINVAAMMVQK